MKRRNVLKGLAALAPLAAIPRLHAQAPKEAGVCRLISQDILGPFAIDETALRRDIIDGQPGVPLELRFLIQDAFQCKPLPGARVSIWHSNAEGFYSGVKNILLDELNTPSGEVVDHTGDNYLRGAQTSDDKGRVVFRTIVPGWYFPRATHLHLQVFPPNYGEVATTQLYFPDAVCDGIYEAGPYAHRGSNPVRTDPNADSPLDGTDESDLWLSLKPQGRGYVAEHTIGVMFYGDMFGELPEPYQQG